jgi:hypothetical protein
MLQVLIAGSADGGVQEGHCVPLECGVALLAGKRSLPKLVSRLKAVNPPMVGMEWDFHRGEIRPIIDGGSWDGISAYQETRSYRGSARALQIYVLPVFADHVRLRRRCDEMPLERVIKFSTPAGEVELKVQQGGAGTFFLALKLPQVPASNEVSVPIPTQLADQLTYSIGKIADASGE